ncbi:proteinrelated to prefoldin subunit 1 [Metarhizium robertsii ARSEF 23]|uniref:Proteinrelated to prefoldin subunit 1 n=3 Tax=Metarhizium TaxID=5529 RepID=E9ELS5_METRA
MSISNEALHKLAREIETQAVAAQQQIGLARTQMAAKQREQRLVSLTLSELASLPEEAVVYEGVGKILTNVFYILKPRTKTAASTLNRCSAVAEAMVQLPCVAKLAQSNLQVWTNGTSNFEPER